MRADRPYLTPPEYGRRIGVHRDRIIAFIRRGELRAIDVSEPGTSRPRYRISPEAIAEFERRRSAVALPKPIRRRRHPTIKSFF
jgi:hypothetical protein